MSKKLSLALYFVVASPMFAWLAACLDVSPISNADSGSDSSAGDGPANSGDSTSARDGITDSRSDSDGGVTDAAAEGEAEGLGLLVDNMTAMKGTQISLQVPDGESPGSYYAYSDYPVSNALGMMSIVSGTSQLLDVPLSTPITNGDGSQIVGELCFGGSVVGYSGLGMSLAYGNPPDATPESGLSSPVPFDASHYGGVSFYILVDPSDGPSPSIRFGIPDTQTADPAAWPAACSAFDGGICDDDFGSDVTFTQGTWTKASFQWTGLNQVGFGTVYSALKTDQLIGMKWQVNGGAVDAASESFQFCI
jgi:hypothetical protein